MSLSKILAAIAVLGAITACTPTDRFGGVRQVDIAWTQGLRGPCELHLDLTNETLRYVARNRAAAYKLSGSDLDALSADIPAAWNTPIGDVGRAVVCGSVRSLRLSRALGDKRWQVHTTRESDVADRAAVARLARTLIDLAERCEFSSEVGWVKPRR